MTGSPGSSPSTWLNLDGDDEGERMQETREGPTTEGRRARGQGQNKMPQGRYVVTEVTAVGEPASPSIVPTSSGRPTDAWLETTCPSQ